MDPNIGEQEDATLPISSLIDVVFLLIMFFVITSSLEAIVIDSEITLSIAEDMQVSKYKPLKDLIITITKEGKFKVDKQYYKKEDLKALVANKIKGNNALPVLVRTDQDTLFKDMDTVFTILKESNVSKIRFTAEVKK